MRQLTTAICLACSLGAGVALADSVGDVRTGNAAFGDGRYDAAIELFSRAILAGDLEPEALAITFNNRGVAYSELGDYDRAIKDYQQALALVPKDPTAIKNLRIAHIRRAAAESAARRPDRRTGRLQPGDRAGARPSTGLHAPRPAAARPRRQGGGGRRPYPSAATRPGQQGHRGPAGGCAPRARCGGRDLPEGATAGGDRRTRSRAGCGATGRRERLFDRFSAGPSAERGGASRAVARRPPPSSRRQGPERPAEPDSGATHRVTADVNLRQGPGNEYPRIGAVARGTSVAVVGERLGWLQIRLASGGTAGSTRNGWNLATCRDRRGRRSQKRSVRTNLTWHKARCIFRFSASVVWFK